MRAWLMNSFTGVGDLRLGDAEDPRPGPGEALLRIRFAALNPADAFLALAQYPAKPPLPHILGRDGVGEVLAVGPGVANVRVGDTVGILRTDVGVTAWGTLAEKTVAGAASLAPIPPGWSIEQMAAAPLVFLTAWQALTQWGETEVPAGEHPGSPAGPFVAGWGGRTLLVTGASGGVGVAAVLLGKSLGYRVIGLSRSKQKGEKLKELGADFVFDPADPQLRKAILGAAQPRRVDLVVDSVAGPLFNELVGVLGYGGKISVVGRSGGDVPNFNTATLFFRRNRVGGVSVGDYSPEEAQAAWTGIVSRLNAAGQRPVIDHVFPFEDVPAAFARLSEGPMGKVLVRVAG